MLLIIYLAAQAVRQGQVVPVVRWGWASDEAYEMVGQDDLPDFPTPIVVTDRRGRAKWTVSIPASYQHPLTPKEYSDVCAKCREVAMRVHVLHTHSPVEKAQITFNRGDTGNDRYFIDVKEAEKQGYLPGPGGMVSGRGGDLVGVDESTTGDKQACTSSLTYVLESDDAGLGKTLMSLWVAYGLARREGRAFFIQDARWAYGKYADIFDMPPVPACRPPPRHEMIPCPRNARHLIISSANARDILGAHIPDGDTYTEGPAASLDHRSAQRELFAMARTGYDALFRLVGADRDYVSNRLAELRARTTSAAEGAAAHGTGKIVGVHVRHGDRHPLEFQYADSYIPLAIYADAAHARLNTTLGGGDHALPSMARTKSLVILASDDPLVYHADEFRGAARAQEQIRLAGKEELPQNSKPDKSVMHKFVDETFGWEGGFFAAMFWNLGLSSSSAAAAAAANNNNNNAAGTGPLAGEETIRLRSLVGRAYLMDLAVLSEATDGGGVVCAVGAMGCRLLAVMMGAERAFSRGEWVNVDGEFGWTGATWV